MRNRKAKSKPLSPPSGPGCCTSKRVGRHDNFFELGGHSLLAVQRASRIRSQLGAEVALSELFAQPTLQTFAMRISAAGASALPDTR